ncbi:hypothetical protein QQS21_006364 [Conoideocrella luteorostrata]|uniref:Uncharacterized protein n=1 Tax=Conoideocrella luteorostrata TaxID=1105319 RepID=A0AAJ0FYC1_9HYPO|nr:hypothetical protein QQS21_006364 [Conoideocrella luteorostrata]
MGQYFEIAALGHRRILPKAFIKLGEFLFHHPTAADLAALLAVPVRPTLQSINGRSKYTSLQLAQGAGNVEKTKGNALKSKAPQQVQYANHKNLAAAATATRPDKHMGLFKLPPELQVYIFESIDHIAGVICFGLTNRFHWSIAQEHLLNFYMTRLGQWANQKIICVGDYVRCDDLPRGMVLSQEWQEWLESFEREESEDEEPKDDGPVTLYHIVCSFRQQRVESVHSIRSDLDLQLFDMEVYDDPAFRVYKDFARSLREDDFFPKNEDWILRNLTTKQYVRSDAVALNPKYINGPNIGLVGFGEVVLSRIAWTSDPSVSMQNDTDIHRGRWAGHCFDITTMARHQRKTLGQIWTDVSEEVAQEIDLIWTSEFGSDWKKQACESL